MSVKLTQIQKWKEALEQRLDMLFHSRGYNEYAVLYYEGKIDAMRALLNNGDRMLELDEAFGL